MPAPGRSRRRPADPLRSPFFWLLVVLSLATLAAGGWSFWQDRQRLAVESQPAGVSGLRLAPDFRLETIDGGSVRLSDLRGQVVLLNFWATWCPPCIAELPDLDALHREHGAAKRFTVLAVDVAESREAVVAFRQRRGLTLPMLLDDAGEVSGPGYLVRTLPMSLIVDRQGYIRDQWTGRISKAAMLARLQQVW
jgi:thiol-disulfide isomerase/thioredoxin